MPPDAAPIPATLDSPFQLQLGQTALLQAQGISVKFVEVVEDSRCPMGVECVWAGQALILIQVSSQDDALGIGVQERTLQVGLADSVDGVSDSYLFEFLSLAPLPQASEQGAQVQPDYIATLVVSK